MWNKMEIFYHIVKAGSFTKAEKIMNKSQATLTYSIQVLEGRLGCTLFYRGNKGLVLTRKGEEVFQSAQCMVMEMEGLRAVLDDKKGIEGKIRVSTTHSIMDYILSDHLIAFNIKYPGIVFEVFARDSLVDIVYNEVDVAVRLYDPTERSFIQKHLFTTLSGLYASKSYIEKYGEPRTIKDLDSHKLIVRSRPKENPYSDVEWSLKLGRDDGSKRDPVFTGNSTESLFKAASEGLGIITAHSGMEVIKRYKLKKVFPDLKPVVMKHCLVYPKHLEKVERVVVLGEFLMKQFEDMR